MQSTQPETLSLFLVWNLVWNLAQYTPKKQPNLIESVPKKEPDIAQHTPKDSRISQNKEPKKYKKIKIKKQI